MICKGHRKMDENKTADGNLSPGKNRVKLLLERFEKPEIIIARKNNPLLTVRDRLVSV